MKLNYQEVFKEREKIDSKKLELLEEMKVLNQRQNRLFENCQHEIIFQYHDDFPKKMENRKTYFCPACGLIHDSIDVSAFQNSRIIPLSNLSLVGTIEVLQVLRNEVFQNFDFYYNSGIRTELLSQKMEEILSPYQMGYTVNKIKRLTRGRK